MDHADTIAHNRTRQDFSGRESVWLFGYGSLIYKVDFPYLERHPASIEGWVRRFWQGSHDHRGTPENPGRVVTLVEQAQAICHGMAYRVSPDVFQHLDVREKNGYLRFTTTLRFREPFQALTDVEGLVYIATADNPAYLGPAEEADIAAHIAHSRGPSGANEEYLRRLADSLRELGADDPHVFAIERHL